MRKLVTLRWEDFKLTWNDIVAISLIIKNTSIMLKIGEAIDIFSYSFNVQMFSFCEFISIDYKNATLWRYYAALGNRIKV